MIGRRPHLALIPALALVLTGCDGLNEPAEPEQDYVAVCTDHTGQRVDDDKCQGAPDQHDRDDHSGGFLWFYMATTGGHTAPPVGHRITTSSGTYRTPAARTGDRPVVVGRGGSVPTGGGAIARGGFGGAAKSGGSSGS